MELIQETLEVYGRGLFVALEREQSTETRGALLRHAAIGAIGQVPLQLFCQRRSQTPLRELIKQPLCFPAIHTSFHK
jgi:hypothetical protein